MSSDYDSFELPAFISEFGSSRCTFWIEGEIMENETEYIHEGDLDLAVLLKLLTYEVVE